MLLGKWQIDVTWQVDATATWRIDTTSQPAAS
jgi:hypothetical protein